MDNLEYHRKLFALLLKAKNPVFDAQFVETDTEELKDDFISLGASVESTPGKIRIKANSLKTKLFGSESQLFAQTKLVNDMNILIFDQQLPISYFDGLTYENFIEVSNNYLITNAISYLAFQAFLKLQENEIDESIHFVDSFNLDFRKIVLVSLSDKGRITMTYEKGIPPLNRSVDYTNGFTQFVNCFNEPSRNLSKFLKSAVIEVLGAVEKEKRFQYFFENLNVIVVKATMNFEVYLNNLSIEKIRKDYDEVKSKFFKDLSDILNKLTQQIIAIPIGISATLLAVDKITENTFYLYFISIALCVTSTYLSLLLRSQFQDLHHLKKLFDLDYKLLIGNNFFIKYPDEKKVFNEIRTRFESKISFLKNISESYFWILNISSVAIVAFIIQKLLNRFSATLMLTLILMFAVAIFRNYVRAESDDVK